MRGTGEGAGRGQVRGTGGGDRGDRGTQGDRWVRQWGDRGTRGNG